jgi:hypothetical protein
VGFSQGVGGPEIGESFLFVRLVKEKLSDLVHIHLRWLVAKIINWSPI